jgi:hypothetical protein
LFADDTVVYLTSEDEMQTLDMILDKWCLASGARFNKGKTQIIPIGPKELREQIISTRKLAQHQTEIPNNIHIVQEGEATRILGAWMGNETNEEAIWSPILEKIDSSLKYWEKLYPTIEGRKIITQWVVGGKSQYLTAAQGMPKDIEKQLIKKIKEFIWNNNSRSTISQDILCVPIDQGGKALLHLEARNEAIELNWLKELINQTNPWTHFANALIAKCVRINPKVNPKAQQNYFSQSWEFTFKHLPLGLQRIMKVKKKYNVQIEALAIPQDIKSNMPIWFHVAASNDLKSFNNHHYSTCLRDNHEIQTVGQMCLFISRSTPDHRQRNGCICDNCTADKAKGCKKPFECRKLAKKIMNCIPPKWHPHKDLARKIKPLMPSEKEKNETAIEDKRGLIFDPNIYLEGPITNAMRVFTDGSKADNETPLGQPHSSNSRPKKISVITAGKYAINENGDHISGGGAWFKKDTYTNISIKPVEEMSSPDSGELCVILRVLKQVPKSKKLYLHIQSKYILKALTTDFKRNESLGWLYNPNADIFKAIIAELRQRSSRTKIKLRNTGCNPINIKKADELAKQALLKQNADEIYTYIDRCVDLQGMNLNQGSQAQFYRGIFKFKAKVHPRQQTIVNLAIARHAVHEINGVTPTDPQIWKSIRNKDLPKSIQGFLWKTIHNAFKIGNFWTKIPEYEQRANCSLCGEVEDMDHILVDCPNSLPCKIIWNLAKMVWEMKGEKWEKMTFGKIMGCNLLSLKNQKGKPKKGKNRLYTIIISESAFLIWKLRCQKVIEFGSGRDHSEIEIHNKWVNIINSRLKLDKILTNSHRYGNKAIPKDKVLETWSGVLYDEESLPDDWIKQSEVLVGIASRRPRGRNC